MKNVALIILVFVLSACGNNDNKGLTTTQTVKIRKDSSRSNQQQVKTILKKDTFLNSALDTLKRNNTDTSKGLLGIWILKDSNNPAFYIKKSTIYYPEHFKSYKYAIIGDSIRIMYDGYNERFAYKFNTKDTLLLNSADYGESIYYRQKN